MLLQAGFCSVFFEGATHGDVSFGHAEHTIKFGEKSVHIGVYCYFPSGSLFCLLKGGVSSRRLSTQNIRFGEKLVRIGVYCYFPSRSIFVCSKEASRRDVSFEHTEYTL